MAQDDTTSSWEKRAAAMRGRDLTADEKAAVGEAILQGSVHPGVDARAKKRIIRKAIDSVRPRIGARS
ncbi:hypothetical protein GCM10011390_30540 [Aureimonas endophytica]|uniref:Uncharacterized protein n=1 Tax=Aureimonas endophytica TaxID=2027858 RepID=A0A917E6Y8_9HYPH|nr:hypothetical protein [Aureimonas endophytica]GGE09333.1 hypothetical protein GCM10011390_30540 [Aureimonas endophytica]